MLRRGGTKKIARFLGVPPLLNTITQGGFTGKKKKTTISQLMPLATFVPSLVRCGQGPWLSIVAQIKQFFFGVTLACLDISSKKKCLYRLFIYHFKAHTISNKLV